MMKYTNSFDDDDSCSAALPPMRPCSTATTTPSINQRGRDVKAAIRRALFEDEDNRTVISSAKSLGGYGADSSYISLREDDAHVSDDETICSSSLYSLHNYSPAMKKEHVKEKEKAKAERKNNFCSLDDILDDDFIQDTVESFKQVVYAFAISPKDIDGVADAIKDARDEIAEIEVERRLSKLRELESRL